MNNVIFNNIEGMKVPWFNWASSINDDETFKQMYDLAKHPGVYHHVASMPDAHAGYGMPIGGVAAFSDMLIPYAVGNDIGCSMLAMKFNIKESDVSKDELTAIMSNIKDRITMGQNKNSHDWIKFNSTDADKWLAESLIGMAMPESVYNAGVDEKNVISSLKSLGSGNHFIECQTDKDSNIWFMIHSGSRNIGARVCNHYHKLAEDLNKTWHSEIPTEKLAFLPISTKEGQDYLEAMQYCLKFSEVNKLLMMREIIRILNDNIFPYGVVDIVEEYSCLHNYARLENHFGKNVWVHRKGACAAQKDQYAIIPGSMGSHSYIVKGTGNEKSFKSCSHGAGRAMSRTAAKAKFSMDDFEASMSNIMHESRNSLIDECPMAYKEISGVMMDQEDLVEIVYELTPIMNLKG